MDTLQSVSYRLSPLLRDQGLGAWQVVLDVTYAIYSDFNNIILSHIHAMQPNQAESLFFNLHIRIEFTISPDRLSY